MGCVVPKLTRISSAVRNLKRPFSSLKAPSNFFSDKMEHLIVCCLEYMHMTTAAGKGSDGFIFLLDIATWGVHGRPGAKSGLEYTESSSGDKYVCCNKFPGSEANQASS